MRSEAKPGARCAIYTRKSSEEGLEQSFNSLDAQREACRSFISSQTHEGWRALTTLYDDGGYSGATMDRPALKHLLEDIHAQKIDTVVVYKVDRLTRSLADFAKIIEIFDTSRVSFVSVTQQFNTTSSMGRLTLNVLLSFAQFEREVTGERIRDKIAASKRKGMWMGGSVPLGYEAKERKLVVNPSEAERVREIYRSYLKIGCVSKLKIHLEQKGILSKERKSQTGRKTGGAAFSRGALYSLLQNRIYTGEIEHKEKIYPGEHQGIVSPELWKKVQAQLRANQCAYRNNPRAAVPSLLVGLVHDDSGNRFTPTHAVKNGKRYRYYVSQAAIKNPGLRHAGPVRVPAGEIETLICSRLSEFLRSPDELLDVAPRAPNPAITRSVVAAAKEWSKRLASVATTETRTFIRSSVSRIVLRMEDLDVLVDKRALWSLLLEGRLPTPLRAGLRNGLLRLKIKVSLQRCGGEVRLIPPVSGGRDLPEHPTHSLIKAVARAHSWYGRIVRGELSGRRSIAKAISLDERYVSRIFRCAFLAPDIVENILDGRQPPKMTVRILETQLPIEWAAQRRLLGFPAR